MGKAVKKIVSVSAPIAGFALGGPVGAAIGGGIGGAASGKGLKGIALGAGLGYLGGKAATSFGGAPAPAATSSTVGSGAVANIPSISSGFTPDKFMSSGAFQGFGSSAPTGLSALSQNPSILGNLSGNGLSAIQAVSPSAASVLGTGITAPPASIIDKLGGAKGLMRSAGAINSAISQGQYADDIARAGSEAAAAADPFAAQRGQYQTQLNQLYSDPYSITQRPSYKFRLGEGLQALDRRLAATGQLNSGRRQAALVDYAQGVASSEFDNESSRLSQLAGANSGSPGEAGASIFRARDTAAGAKAGQYNDLFDVLSDEDNPWLNYLTG